MTNNLGFIGMCDFWPDLEKGMFLDLREGNNETFSSFNLKFLSSKVCKPGVKPQGLGRA